MALISFARGMPGPDLLPIAEFGDCARAALERDGATALNYGPPGGYPPLRSGSPSGTASSPRACWSRTDRCRASPSSRATSSGGSRFFVEAPCYDRSLSILRRSAPRSSRSSSRTTASTSTRSPARSATGDVVYTIPTFQNPSGRTLSRENRLRLLDLAAEPARVVSRTTRTGCCASRASRSPRLFELSEGVAVFLSSFSKTVAPGIRIGYVILPEELVPAIEALVLENYVSPAIFVQAALYEFVPSGRFEPNLERVRDGLRIRRDAMLAALERELPEGASWNQPEGGYFLWLDLPSGVVGGTLLARASEEDVTFVKGADFFFHGGGRGSRAARVLLRDGPRDRRGHRPARPPRARRVRSCGVTGRAVTVARLDEISRSLTLASFVTLPVRVPLRDRVLRRQRLRGRGKGGRVIEEHDELGDGAGRHEELYFVVSGHAVFDLAGAGSRRACRHARLRHGPGRAPRRERERVRTTVVLVVGGVVGQAFEPSPWEAWLEALPLLHAEDYDQAIEVIERTLEAHPDNPNVLYNLACFEALAGRRDEALSTISAGRSSSIRARRVGAGRRGLRLDPRRPALSRCRLGGGVSAELRARDEPGLVRRFERGPLPAGTSGRRSSPGSRRVGLAEKAVVAGDSPPLCHRFRRRRL